MLILSSLRRNDIDTDQDILDNATMSLDDSTSALRRYPSDPQQQSITGGRPSPLLTSTCNLTTAAAAASAAASPKQLHELQVAAVTAASRAAVLEEDLGALQAELQAERCRAQALESRCNALAVQLVRGFKGKIPRSICNAPCTVGTLS